jgi:hypothetical protein
MSDASKPQDGTQPKKGGFGAFSQQYRDRWADKHPTPLKGRPATPPTGAAEPGAPEPPASGDAPPT